MPRRIKTLKEQYHVYLRKFMNWKDQAECAENHEFTQAQLLEIRPSHLVRCMHLLAYGSETPAADDRPTLKRSSGLDFVKKALSHFMPNQNAKWNVESETGNPTMSVAVNKVIKQVKREEVRKRGKKSSAKRHMKRPEFRQTLRLLENHNDFHCNCRTPAMMKVQFHIIARADDTSNIETEDMREHEQFGSFCAQTKVLWSKNALEERNCLDQTLIGALDPDFCVSLALACYLETRFFVFPQHDRDGMRFPFGSSFEDDEPIRVNERHQNTLRAAWQKNEMKALTSQVRGELGSHSVRKFPSTWAAEHGISQDDIEVRGRWKGGRNGRTVNRHINVDQLPTDGKVAAVLCVGGPCKCRAHDGSGLTHQWLMDHVVSGLHGHYQNDPNNKLPLVLACPLLWCAFQAGLEHMMAPGLRQRIRNAHNAIRPDDLHEDWNPVNRVPLIVTRVENSLVIDEMTLANPDQPVVANPEEQAQGTQNAQALVGHREQLQAVLNQMHHLRQEMSEVRIAHNEAMLQLREFMNSKFKKVNENVSRLRQAAPFAAVANGDNGAPVLIPAGDAGVAAPPPGRNATLSTQRDRRQSTHCGMSVKEGLADVWLLKNSLIVKEGPASLPTQGATWCGPL